MTEVQINSYGWNVDLTVKDKVGAPVDLSLATTTDFVFQKPDGKAFKVSAVFVTDGTDGQLRYLIVVGKIDKVGYVFPLESYDALGTKTV